MLEVKSFSFKGFAKVEIRCECCRHQRQFGVAEYKILSHWCFKLGSKIPVSAHKDASKIVYKVMYFKYVAVLKRHAFKIF